MPFKDIIIKYKVPSKLRSRFKQNNFILDTNNIVTITQDQLYNICPTTTHSFECVCDHCNNEFNITGEKLHRSQGKSKSILEIKDYQDNLTLCKICRQKLTFFKHFDGKYPAQTEEFIKKREITVLNKYGVKNIFELNDIKHNIRVHNLQKYGYEYVMQVPEIKEKVKQKNSDKTFIEKQLIQEKAKQTNLKRYGVEYTFQAVEIKEKIKQTNLKKYGVEYASQALEVKEQIKQTNLQRYGVEYTSQVPEVREKIQETNLQRYGVKNPLQNLDILEKMKQTNLQRYGYEYTLQSPEIQAKSNKTYFYNQSGPISRQQQFLYTILFNYYNNCKLNYPFANYILDIALLNEQINIEYNGGGHELSIKLGNCTQEEFKYKEIKRNEFIRSQNWKQIFIIAPHDKIKNYIDIEYIKMIYIAKQYLLNTTHHWVNIYIEENKFETSVYTQAITNILNL